MITLISALLGFAGSMVPEVLSLFRDHTDRKHELKILEMQLKQQAQGHSERLEEIRLQGEASEMRSLYKTYYSGVAWVDALNATVRPVLAYAFFLLYAGVKCLQLSMPEVGFEAALLLLWSEEDQAIFAGIISFYFGQRAFRKRA